MEQTTKNRYFKWLCYIVQPKKSHYNRLLEFLHSREFTWSYSMDANRAFDGIELRRTFASEENYDRGYITGPCSMLEMMIGLAMRMENDIMDNIKYGDRTSQWFWTMVNNLGLGSMTDSKFNEEEADYIIDRFINHNYEPNGKGGLFIVDGDEDLRDEEIWVQMCWYISTLEE